MIRPLERPLARAAKLLRGMVTTGLVALAITTPGLAQPSPQANALQADLQAEAALLARIRAEIGDAHCITDSDCLTLPISAKACGGSGAWLAWSTTTGQGDLLKTWAMELAGMQRRRYERHGMASTCQYVTDPGAICQDRQCRMRSRPIEN